MAGDMGVRHDQPIRMPHCASSHTTPAAPRTLQVGHWVLALGHPWGVAGAVTAGVVIGVGASPEAPHKRGEWIHASLHLRPGHSGGPLVDVYGHVVGINTMMAGPDVGLAIPVSVVQGFVRQVRECREEG